MDIHGEDSFKAKSYSSAAFNIERLPAEIATMSDAELFGIRGIGTSTGKKIRELQATGKLPALEELLARTPPGLLDIMNIKGLGPKKIATIWKEMGIESLGELEYACNENRLVALKGFGAKTQESVLQNIQYFNQNRGFHLWAEVEAVAASVLKQLRGNHPDNLFELTGEIRRQNETIEFVEVLTDLDMETLYMEFDPIPNIVIEEDEVNGIPVLRIQVPGQPKFKFYLTDTDRFYSTLFTTTAAEEFFNAFIKLYTVDEFAESEESIFTRQGLTYIPPMQRETLSAIEKAKQPLSGKLIEPQDIKAIIHAHSTWSDGVNTIAEMARAARDMGLEYLVISDHSQTAFYAGGLKPEQVAAQHQEIDALNAKLAPFKIFKSIESDILGDGSLDYSPQVLDTFDLVIASVHSNLKMTQNKAMDRVLTAIRNPFTTILGHPTGRLLLSRKGYPLDHKAVIDACAEHNVVLEINAHPRRLDLDWRWIEYAMARGVLLSVDPDAHAIEGFRDTYYGTMIAQKGGLTAQHNLSSFSLSGFEAFLAKYRQKKQAAVAL